MFWRVLVIVVVELVRFCRTPACPLDELAASNPNPKSELPVRVIVTLTVYVVPGTYPLEGMLSVMVIVPPAALSALPVWQPDALQVDWEGPALYPAIPLSYDMRSTAKPKMAVMVIIFFFILVFLRFNPE